jgi:hypothetical protein
MADNKPDNAAPVPDEPAPAPAKKKSLSQLANLIRKELEAIDQGRRSQINHARAAGDWLREAKADCEEQHVQWTVWVTGNCKVSYATVSNYIRISERWAELEAWTKKNQGKVLTIPKALQLLADPKIKEERARKKAEEQQRRRDQPDRTGTERQRNAMTAILEERGIQGVDAATAIGLVWRLGIEAGTEPEQVLAFLDLKADEMDKEAITKYLLSLKDESAAWDEAVAYYDVLGEQFASLDRLLAEAAFHATKDVNVWQETADEKKRPGKEWDVAICSFGRLHYLARSSTFNPGRIARRTVEWLLGKEGGEWLVHEAQEELDEGVFEKLRALAKSAARSSRPTTPTQPNDGGT